jgi:riboflavin synthase
MFTGIVEAVGRIAEVRQQAGGRRLLIDAGTLDVGDVAVGDSVAIAGCCLTVVAIEGRVLAFDASQETLRCTHGLDRDAEVNLEKALRLGERLGGHLVSGHVDGVGVVTRFEPPQGDPESRLLEIEAPAELARFIAVKGSIAVDGVSLTVNSVSNRCFAANLIPHSLAVTTLGRLRQGARVNLEVDVVARYVERLADFAR